MGKTEWEKMLSAELYTYADDEVRKSVIHSNKLCARLRTMTLHDASYREVIEELIPSIPASSSVNPPFHCDHGVNIQIGENVFINYNCIFLDGGKITIGDNVLIGPDCKLFTPQHPMNYKQRRIPQEICYPVSIGDDTWLGGNVTVCPGVRIGKRCIIGAGSVVLRDIPDDTMVAGNPAVVIKSLK